MGINPCQRSPNPLPNPLPTDLTHQLTCGHLYPIDRCLFMRKVRKPRSRPPISAIERLTDRHLAEVLEGVRAGAFDYEVAAAIGVHPATFLEWKRRGRADFEAGEQTRFSRLYLAVTKARGELRYSLAKKVAERNPEFVLKVLSRADAIEHDGPGWNDPKEQIVRVEHEGQINHVHIELDQDRLAAVSGALEVFRQLELDARSLPAPDIDAHPQNTNGEAADIPSVNPYDDTIQVFYPDEHPENLR